MPKKTIDSVTRCIKVVGDAAGWAIKANPQIVSAHPEMSLLEARDARNAAIHEYEEIEADNLFLTVDEVLKTVAAATRFFLAWHQGIRLEPSAVDRRP